MMFLRVRLLSPFTLNAHFSPSLSSLSSSSKICSDQNPSCTDRSLGFFYSWKSAVPFALSLSRRRSGCGFLPSRCAVRFCRASSGNVSREPEVGGDDDSDQYIQALLLVPETVRHYNSWKQGFIEETKLHLSGKKYPFSSHRRRVDNVHSVGHDFLRRFQSPTVFLKIACDGDLLLPIIVGEFAIIRLIDAISGEEHEECPDQFQFVKNIVGTFGYEVRNFYNIDWWLELMQTLCCGRHCDLFYCKHGQIRCHCIYVIRTKIFTNGLLIYENVKMDADNTSICIDARPSDALNLAERFKAPIYVNKEIVVKDAIKVVYGNWRAGTTKMVYDVSLDSAPEEPDPLIEELDLVQKMNEAVLEERFEDAALWRDKLTKLKMPGQEL
ncbi:bifunctional nuclease 2 isoform X2 [Dendrobium catenatum]|uniref:bifunctional nuclease 2 isoform X2 n=1 Tax=Dendrobium catenatum TaxID=906689 RepID=UPI0009F548D1|nr:bifunctional nuclease 2 isoform X2 [Dendrobium catenatum]